MKLIEKSSLRFLLVPIEWIGINNMFLLRIVFWRRTFGMVKMRKIWKLSGTAVLTVMVEKKTEMEEAIKQLVNYLIDSVMK